MSEQQQQPEGLINENQAAKVLGVRVSNLRYRRWQGMAPEWIRIGGRVRYRPSTLQAFIEESTVRLRGNGAPVEATC